MSKLDRAAKTLGDETVADMDAMGPADLRARIVQANEAMDKVEKELEANDKYQELKESKKAMESGKREVDKRQKAVICYALHILDGGASDEA